LIDKNDKTAPFRRDKVAKTATLCFTACSFRSIDQIGTNVTKPQKVKLCESTILFLRKNHFNCAVAVHIESNRIANLLTCRWVTLTPVEPFFSAFSLQGLPGCRCGAQMNCLGQHSVGGDSTGTERLRDNALRRLLLQL